MELKLLEHDKGLTHLALIGKLDIAGVNAVDQQFHAQVAGRRQPTIVDLSQVDFISSLGIGMLMACAVSLRKRNTMMVLVKPQQSVEQMLTMARITAILPIAGSEQDARKLISGG